MEIGIRTGITSHAAGTPGVGSSYSCLSQGSSDKEVSNLLYAAFNSVKTIQKQDLAVFIELLKKVLWTTKFV